VSPTLLASVCRAALPEWSDGATPPCRATRSLPGARQKSDASRFTPMADGWLADECERRSRCGGSASANDHALSLVWSPVPSISSARGFCAAAVTAETGCSSATALMAGQRHERMAGWTDRRRG
jgi:hypothetical protein